ncbi:MAG: hypothetical protein M3478_07330, partial [Planctomycetota bacterium]|nr:hypothetical protein [Planctomycetota bacterium]
MTLSSSRIGWALACVVACVLAPTLAPGDTLKLKDGTTVEGSVSVIGTMYTVKLADGTTRRIGKDQIAEHTKGSTATTTGSAGGGETAPAAAPAVSGGAALLTIKSKADRSESPILAVQMWEKFLDGKPDAADAETGKSELAKWQKLEKDKAEKINGKWVGGAEKKELLKRVRALVAEGYKSLDSAQTLEGVKKLEEAVKLYPNSFDANFGLGY